MFEFLPLNLFMGNSLSLDNYTHLNFVLFVSSWVLVSSAESAQRADVRFDSLSVGIGSSPTFTVKWLFDLVYFFRKDDGAKSWLETTHVSENLRLGRGNKGSIFILTR
jgi:hypothetical protein